MRKWFRSCWSRVVFGLMETAVYAWVMYKLPLVRFSTYYSSIHGKTYREGYDLLRPGDILLTKDKWKLTSFLIPGEFPHAALCVRKSPQVGFEVAEMTRVGYRMSEFFDLCHEADHVLILRCDAWDDEYVKKVVETCLSYEGTDYDIAFELGVKTLYCSELVVASDPEKRLKVSYDDLIGLGRPYISPTGLLRAKNIEIVWDSSLSRKVKRYA